MSALTYLTLTRLKNGIRDLLRKPARLIYVVFLLALLVFAVQGSGSTYPPESYRDLREVVAMATALFLFIFLLTVWNGFSTGGTIFSLSDVNLLFPSPIHRTRTLFYGLLRQIITALLLGIFLFYQYGWLHNLYGITMASMVALFLCYTAAVFLGQVTAMTIYTFTSSHEGAQKLLKGLIILCLLLVAGWLFWGFWTSPDQRLAGVIDASVSLPVQLFPVGGWLGWVFSACLGLGTWWPGLLLCLAWFFLLLFLLTHFDRDWYEDVLRTAELAQSAIVAKKEGTMESVPGKVRIGATGLKKGWGASAFYYKHKIENRRGSWMLLPPASLIFAVVLIGFSFFMRESGILPVFAFAVYLQLFTAGQSRINRELYKPFIYLVPESSFSKLLHCLRELVPGGSHCGLCPCGPDFRHGAWCYSGLSLRSDELCSPVSKRQPSAGTVLERRQQGSDHVPLFLDSNSLDPARHPHCSVFDGASELARRCQRRTSGGWNHQYSGGTAPFVPPA